MFPSGFKTKRGRVLAVSFIALSGSSYAADELTLPDQRGQYEKQADTVSDFETFAAPLSDATIEPVSYNISADAHDNKQVRLSVIDGSAVLSGTFQMLNDGVMTISTEIGNLNAVSYTHLTLPTTSRV